MDAVQKSVAALEAVVALHKPITLYEECGHTHEDNEPNVMDVPDVGFVCQDGKLYDVCNECCTDGDSQNETCAGDHDHGKDKPICKTIAVIKNARDAK